MSTAIHRFVERCRSGEHPGLIARVDSGWAIMGDIQVVRGYCLVLPDPVPAHLNALDEAGRATFLRDCTRLGDAILHVTGADRINYEFLGNQEPALHGHVIPRSASEPESLRTRPIWFFDWETAPRFDAAVHGALLREIRECLAR